MVRMMKLKGKMESLSLLSFCFHFDRLVRNGAIKRRKHMRQEGNSGGREKMPER